MGRSTGPTVSDVDVQVTPAPTVWESGREPGRDVAVLGVAVTLSAVAIDVLLSGRLSLFFDLCFVALCLFLALRVRPKDFFTVGVLPPLMMVGVFWLLAVTDRTSIARADDGVIQAVVSGLTHHSGALAAGYAVCLGCLAYRQRLLSQAGHAASYSSKRVVSPAP